MKGITDSENVLEWYTGCACHSCRTTGACSAERLNNESAEQKICLIMLMAGSPTGILPRQWLFIGMWGMEIRVFYPVSSGKWQILKINEKFKEGYNFKAIHKVTTLSAMIYTVIKF